MDLVEEVVGSLRDEVFVEAKTGEWWDRLPGKRRNKVVAILGLDKGKSKTLYDKLDSDEQSEVSAYFKKHKGRVEGFEDEGEDVLSEAKWIPDSLSDSEKALVSSLGKKIKWKAKTAKGIVVALLADVNLHQASEKVNAILTTIKT
jgi:hypothetical protein